MESYADNEDEERPANSNKMANIEVMNELAGDDFDDEDDVDASDETASLKNLSSGPVKEISAPYDMPHYPIEVAEQMKIVMPHMEQFAFKEFEEKEKALPTSASVKGDTQSMTGHFPASDASYGEPSACNSGVASGHQLDTGNAGLTTPVTGNKQDSLLNGGLDSGLRSPEANEEIDYVPHFQRVYISGAENALSGVSKLFLLPESYWSHGKLQRDCIRNKQEFQMMMTVWTDADSKSLQDSFWEKRDCKEEKQGRE